MRSWGRPLSHPHSMQPGWLALAMQGALLAGRRDVAVAGVTRRVLDARLAAWNPQVPLRWDGGQCHSHELALSDLGPRGCITERL